MFYFFIFVTTSYFLLLKKFRWMLLLGTGCYFSLAFVPIYILIFGATIVVDYFAGIYLEETPDKKKRIYLIASLIANIGVLCVFKYYNFLNNNLTSLLHGVGYKKPSLIYLYTTHRSFVSYFSGHEFYYRSIVLLR